MKSISKIVTLIFICSQCISHSFADGAYYLVSAYYSPLPWQEFYLHGSYEDEVKMNGEGATTSSGKSVQIGFIAAPKERPFGTRVHINQSITLGGKPVKFDFHGTIQDRGGAIHSASRLPRLDIYVGKGQEWLCRAINFGVQTLYVDFDTNTSLPDTTSLDMISSSCKNPHNERVWLASGTKTAFDPFNMPIWIGSDEEDIKIVQKLLTRTNAYSWPIDGKYNNTLIETILQFQIKHGIVQDKNQDWAGTYGPKTRWLLRALVSWELNKTNNQIVTNTTNTKNVIIAPTNDNKDDNKDKVPTSPTPTQVLSEMGDVREIQEKLKDLGFFTSDIDGIYNKRLVDTIFAFQLEKKIVANAEDPGAGYFWPVTRSALNESHASYILRKEQISKLEKELEKENEVLMLAREKKKLEYRTKIGRIPNLKTGQVHPEIRTLQILLKDLGYLNNKDTAIFWKLTKSALAQYQMKLGVIDSLTSQYAGVLGEKTKDAIATDLFEAWVKTDTTGQEAITRIKAEIEALKKV